MASDSKSIGNRLSEQAEKLIQAVKGCEHVTIKSQGYTVTVQKDADKQGGIRGFGEGQNS